MCRAPRGTKLAHYGERTIVKSGIGNIFSLRRLRWKLALSYTLVAVVTLLAVELFIASGLTAFLISDMLPRTIVTVAWSWRARTPTFGA